MSHLLYSQATAAPAVAGSSRQEAVVILSIEGYREGPVGPEVEVIANTPHNGTRRMVLPASVVEVYTLWLDEEVDYDRMP